MSAFKKWMAYTMANLLRKQFTQWEAYDLGIIDEKGDIIKKPSTKKEKESIDGYINIIRKVKKILVKYIGDNKILNLMISAYILKESEDDENVIDEIKQELTDEEFNKILPVIIQMEKMEI